MSRALSAGLAVALVAAVPAVLMSPAAAAEPTDARAWTPGEAKRDVVGGPPPAGLAKPGADRSGAPSAQRWSPCRSSNWGVLPDYPIERFRVSDRLQFGVNAANGNLWVDHRNLTVRGTGIDLSLRHSFGYDDEWHVNAGRDMALDLSFEAIHMPVDGGGCVEFAPNADGTYASASNGVRATITKNAGGSYTARFTETGETWAFNAGGWPLNRTDRNGSAITYYYHSDGALASLTDSQGRVTTFTSSGGKITRITDPSGTVVGDYTYDAAGKLGKLTDRDGKTVQFTHAASTGRLTSLVDQAGRTWSFAYDDYGDVIKVTTPRQAGAVDTLFAYDTSTQTTETDPNGNKTVYTFDADDRQISAKDALGHTQSTTWTANSDIQSTTDGLTNSTTAAYDSLNNLISTKLPTGATSTIGYTSTAHPHSPTSIKDPAGNEVTREYDSAGNLTKVRSTPLAADLEIRTYTGPKRLLGTVKDANGNVTTFGYDQAGNLTSVTPPAPLGVTRFGYDSLSRITSVTDGNNKRIDYAYDKLDRIVSVSVNGGAVLQTNSYDALGNLVTRSHGGVTSRFSYDAYPTGSQVTSAARTQGAGTETVSYGYDKAGNLTSLADPAGTATYGYDAANRLTSLADPFGQTTTFGYDAADNRTTTTFPGAGTQTNAYDTSSRLTSLSVKNGTGSELLKATYSYTTAGGADSDKLQSKTIAGTTTAYTYDSQRHLTKAGATTFAVDKADNITNLAGTAHTVNAANQLTAVGATTLGYDAAGNITSATNPTASYEYSSTNQLVRGVTGGAQTFTAAYDTIDQTQPRTITETVDGTATTHVFTHTALGTSTVNSGGTRVSVARDPDGRLVTEKAGTTRYNLITDHQGSVLGMLDTAGALAATYTYNPYGGATGTGASGVNPFRYVGGYTLKGGLTLFGHRYYNSSWGRFTAPDPTHQERNRYAYGKSDPVNNTDPTGAYSTDDFEDDLGVVADFAGTGAALGGGGGLIACVVGPVGCATGAGVGAAIGGGLGAVAGISYSITKRINE
ncbi:RHS repeat-containing protein [Saccharothrix espanaensis DSM 44229]|uniref:RHS repeat-containing protein n=2 Tax=Saccharothrix espanaensis TaxID=103731 RepID=K0JXC4_SACES|nr:RHS repeat-containing protein [Saccharothrix espanaensis DSM 44229]